MSDNSGKIKEVSTIGSENQIAENVKNIDQQIEFVKGCIEYAKELCKHDTLTCIPYSVLIHYNSILSSLEVLKFKNNYSPDTFVACMSKETYKAFINFLDEKNVNHG